MKSFLLKTIFILAITTSAFAQKITLPAILKCDVKQHALNCPATPGGLMVGTHSALAVAGTYFYDSLVSIGSDGYLQAKYANKNSILFLQNNRFLNRYVDTAKTIKNNPNWVRDNSYSSLEEYACTGNITQCSFELK